MHLSQIKITNVRNLMQVDVEPNEGFNLLMGENGSGKTSFLEAIYLLALNRSFRTHLNSHLIHHQAKSLTVFAQIENANGSIPIGIEKSSAGTKMRMHGDTINQVAIIAAQLPLQLISADSYKLLQGGPSYRRRFIDWGLFHVEHCFYSAWQAFSKALQQRNAMLKQGVDYQQTRSWDEIFVQSALKLDELRKNYIEALLPIANELLARILDLSQLALHYQSGWDTKRDLRDILAGSWAQDKAMGYSQHGPQRADLQIKVEGKAAQYILSRGQQKMVALSLQLAQGILLRQNSDKKCVYLIDDLAAELDQNHCAQLIQMLSELEAQTFITAVDDVALPALKTYQSVQMFHVKHGCVSQQSIL